jgi:glycosyltransferase involved in cell wall biosynthesis
LPIASSVDVVVPFQGNALALLALVERLTALRLDAPGSITVVDNNRIGVAAPGPLASHVRLLRAPERQSSYHARNRGAACGRAEWLLFLDADVRPPADLIARYGLAAAAPTTAVLAGAVEDVRSPGVRHEPLSSRYCRLRRLIDQQNTLQMQRPYAKTANCAVRRAAFEQVGGFADEIRSGGDADLCFRLLQAGWQLEPRPAAVVEHQSRASLRGLLAQRARHGSGAQWLEERYPGFIGPPSAMAPLARRVCSGALYAVSSLRRGDPDQALVRILDPLSNAAYEAGRRIPNVPWREQADSIRGLLSR